MVDTFFAKNIEKKREYLQDEHKRVLMVVYKNAVDEKCVNNYDFNLDVCQCMKITEIEKETNLNTQIVLTCLRDLESMGFVHNIMLNPDKEYSYAITWLGLKYIEMEAQSVN